MIFLILLAKTKTETLSHILYIHRWSLLFLLYLKINKSNGTFKQGNSPAYCRTRSLWNACRQSLWRRILEVCNLQSWKLTSKDTPQQEMLTWISLPTLQLKISTQKKKELKNVTIVLQKHIEKKSCTSFSGILSNYQFR